MGENREDYKARRLEKRALAARWPISEAQRRAIVCDLAEIAADPKQEARARVRAAAVLVAADKVNMEDEAAAEPAAGPAGVLGTVVHAHVTVAPEAFAAFLEDSKPRQVIEQKPDTSEPEQTT